MTSYRQIEANRGNALRSTGPKTEPGKQASRRNALRHGLTAETVIGKLEDADDYKAFEEAITADYDAQSVVERELVLRLASILWRLRRATTIETGLFEIQAEHLRDYRQSRKLLPDSRDAIHAVFRRADSAGAQGSFAQCSKQDGSGTQLWEKRRRSQCRIRSLLFASGQPTQFRARSSQPL